jgi:dTDP-4-dehydrorhamnose reductase
VDGEICSTNGLPKTIENLTELEDLLTRPDETVVSFLKDLEGDLMILGIGGKIGFDIGVMAKRALKKANKTNKVYGVSRFSNQQKREELEKEGINTIPCDLLEMEQVRTLPKSKNIIFMAGKKFGTSSGQTETWAMNTVMPANVAQYFKDSRIVVFSTGCVYDLTPVVQGGSKEEDPLFPLGEYSNSTVGRERVFGYYANTQNTPMVMFRLNYSNELRYGVLREIGEKVKEGIPVDLNMGHVNVIWQGDVARMALLSLGLCTVPAMALNITGPETISLQYIAKIFGQEFGVEPIFTGVESNTALLSNAAEAMSLFGYPKVSLLTMIRWISHWLKNDGSSLNAPTHFETRDGQY